MDGVEFQGQKLEVQEAKKKRERSGDCYNCHRPGHIAR
jgi:hypothetical protein